MGQYSETIRFYQPSKFVSHNEFIKDAASKVKFDAPISYEDAKSKLPRPIFGGHDDYIKCYDYAWQTAFHNIVKPSAESGFVSSFIDTAFNGATFMWDSCFMMMFTKYAHRAFTFQKTLDNFYAKQHGDGFICREIVAQNGLDRFSAHDPSSTGPDIFAWAELEYFNFTGDMARLSKVYPVLRGFHEWFRKNRTWPDGSYFSSGWGSGMDNIPRTPKGYDPHFDHGHMAWLDTTIEMAFDCDNLIKINEFLGSEDDVSDLIEERARLTSIINGKMWDDGTNFYYDLWECERKNFVKHIGAFWSLIAGIVPDDKIDDLVKHLENEKEFNRPNVIPALSADSKGYEADGSYWCGGVWAPTNYMVLRGLSRAGKEDLAQRIADKALDNVVAVFNKTGTLFENYAPESASEGNPARPNFVGWSGLFPISMFIEYVLGIKSDAHHNRIIWNISKLERHGIENYPLGADITLDLVCDARKSACEEPHITVKSNKPVEIEVIWNNNRKIIK